MDFEGGLVVEGHFAMFVPINRNEDSIQWHLIRNSDGTRLRYRDVRSQCPRRAMLDEVDHESLKAKRAFLGWWSEAACHLGTSDATYNKLDCGGVLAFQNTLIGQLNFAIGAKDSSLRSSVKGTFEMIIQCAERTSVVMYDQEYRRGWLVPALDVIFHIVQAHHHQNPYVANGSVIDITPTKPAMDSRSARYTIIQNRSCRLLESEDYYFEDAVLDLWSLLERLMDKEEGLKASPGVALHATTRSTLHGWEIMALVEGKSILRRKEQNILKVNGGWVNLVNNIDAVILFASGFDDLIKPVNNLHQLCSQRKTLPKEKDYVAAGFPTFGTLYAEASSRRSRKHLTSTHLQWQRGAMFATGLPNNFWSDKTTGELTETGCVIFGQAHHPLKTIRATFKKTNPFHNLPNIPTEHPNKLGGFSITEEYLSPLEPEEDSGETSDNDDIMGSDWMADQTKTPNALIAPQEHENPTGPRLKHMNKDRTLQKRPQGERSDSFHWSFKSTGCQELKLE
ncbi:hypothetical protein OEA41_006165 [Lepraria neglecta]|uniref:Uncharacterized protein n=1 Tax=Lepraria neglecta TaxID=209136 RepID=A0AAE0DKP6_9LECA|nr:hypothetical protein OEA41_006165 [Lepraria neglecta]